MTWDLTMLFIHAAVMLALGVLYRHAPDTVQRLILGLLIVSTGVLCYFYAASVFGQSQHWMWVRIAHGVEHSAVLLYVLRIFISDQERRCLPNSSAHSHNSRP